MNISSQYKLKTISCRRLETESYFEKIAFLLSAVRRRYGQITLFIFIKSVPCKGDTTRWKGKLKQGQKTAFPFPLMVSPWLCKRQANISSLHPYSLPFFIPLHFACRRRPNSVHLFAPFSIAMFTSFSFTPFFYLYFFGLFKSKFISMCIKLRYRLKEPLNKQQLTLKIHT